ncbi:MAG: sn-glycerol-1-phosphate dehydrogenase [Aigarchaeota archaeon]|nr:sn-glycerol-1-phosphate dehydrogenase [Aigarchaeota archaeon]
MSAHEMRLPDTITIGRGLREMAAELVSRACFGKNVVLATSKTPYQLIGSAIANSLERRRIELECHYVEHARVSDVQELEDMVDPEVCGAIVGVGGGRVLDVAKMASNNSAVNFVSVPTTASHDGIASQMASIKGLGTAFSAVLRPPFAVVADMEVIEKAPFRYTASGCGDLIAKYTSVRDWRLGHRRTGEHFGEYAASLAQLSAEIAMRRSRSIGAGDPDSLRTVVEALISSGVAMSIEGTSRPCSGSEHLISHALGRLVENPPLHGECCGVATIVMALLHKANWKRVRRALSEIGAPTDIHRLGVDRETFIEAMLMAPRIRPQRYTILSELKLDKRSAEEAAEKAGVF